MKKQYTLFKTILFIGTILPCFVGRAQAPTGLAAQVYAGGGTVANLTATGNSIKWYATAAGGIALAPTTALIDGSTYFASQTVSGVESTSRFAVKAKKISEASQALPIGSTVANLVSTPSTGAIAQWFTSATGGTALANTTPLANGTLYVEEFQQHIEETLSIQVASQFTPGHIYGVGVLPDGQIVFAGGNYIGGGIYTWNPGQLAEVVSSQCCNHFGIAVAPNGEVIFARGGGRGSAMAILKITAGGVQELCSLPYGGSDAYVDFAFQPDGKILIAYEEPWKSIPIRRVDADGSNMTSVGSGFNAVRAMAVLPDGKIIVADRGNNAIKRMDADGSNIITLGSGFRSPMDVLLMPDGKILVADWGNFALKTMNADGSDIITVASGVNNVEKIALQADGRVLSSSSQVKDKIKRITLASTTNRVPVAINAVVPGPAPIGLHTQVFAGIGVIGELTAEGNAIRWYATASGGTALDNATVLADGTTYYASHEVSGVEVTARLAVAARKISEGTQTFCGAPTVAKLVSTPSRGATARWFTARIGGPALQATAVTEAGIYYVEQFAATPSYTSNRVRVEVLVNPMPPKPIVSSDGQPVPTLSTSAIAGVSHQWYLDGVAIPNATNATYTVPEIGGQGNYAVVKKLNGCASEPSEPMAVVITGDIAIASSLTLSPNPTAEFVHLSLDGFLGEKQVAVHDFTGRLLSVLRTYDEQTSLDVRSYPAGIYFVRVATEKGTTNARFVKK